MKSSVIVVDDHPIVLGSLGRYLETCGYCVLAQVSSSVAALAAADRFKPDVIVMDLMLGGESGIEATRTIFKRSHIPIVAFTGYDSLDHVSEFVKAGGVGFVSKTRPLTDLLDAMKAVLSGKHFLPVQSPNQTDQPAVKFVLSPRENDVLDLLAKGYSSKQIAETLFVSLNTVQTHRLHIFRKLGVHSAVELARYALKYSLLDWY